MRGPASLTGFDKDGAAQYYGIMSDESAAEILLTGFGEVDLSELRDAIVELGRKAILGDPNAEDGHDIVLAAAYDEISLRSQRAAAFEDTRPWCFCVPAADRSLVAAAAGAREGSMLLLPPERRELRRLLVALDEEAKAQSSGDAAFTGLVRLDADFSWKTSAFDVSRVCRRLARFLAEAGFYADRSDEDECALALEEAFVNSVEHGNLDLDSSLKPEDLRGEDRYESERARRLADPAYGNKLVRIRIAMRASEAKVILEDEGRGFDTSTITESPRGEGVSGKGFWLIKRPFDDASYNEKGNSLTLTRRKPGAR
jgi:anti-sigma regulatory factor (Ser/Thr protein kinase)